MRFLGLDELLEDAHALRDPLLEVGSHGAAHHHPVGDERWVGILDADVEVKQRIAAWGDNSWSASGGEGDVTSIRSHANPTISG